MGAMVALDFAILHQEHAKPTRNADEARAFAALLRGLRGLTEQEVRRINVPMAALIGSNDRFMPNVRRLTRVLPRVKVTVINGADHATAPSHPEFSSALLAFLLQQQGR
jgi:pimeloyl-ACP methyl ester carboxylesterase